MRSISLNDAAGPQRRKIVARQGGCKTGEAAITTAGKQKAKFGIHTVGPVWNGGHNNEAEKLASCYKNSLRLAFDNNSDSIAFPCISTGVYHYPIDEAAKVAVKTVSEFTVRYDNPGKVIFVCFDEANFAAIHRLLQLA